jgi:DNA-directed RNA polymerase specialized sigma24 family protein
VIVSLRLHEEASCWEGMAALRRDHGDALMQFYVARLSEGLAEEVTQEVLVAAWEMVPKYRPAASLRAGLFGIARNKCHQAYRNRARRQAIDQVRLEAIRERMPAERPTSPEDDILLGEPGLAIGPRERQTGWL